MQTETILAAHKAGKLKSFFDNISESSKSSSEEKPAYYDNPQVQQAYEIAGIYSKNADIIKHNQQDYEKWDQEKKVANCSRRVANFGIRKTFSGLAERIPRYCNHCDLCYEANTLKLKTKVETIAAQITESTPNGQWRKKTVRPDKEAGSLKKRIKRNQEGRHIEIACSDNSGKVEIWSYVENEPDKDQLAMNEAYGEPAELSEVEFDKLYKQNRSTGKKLSVGAAFKSSGASPKKTDTERVLLPDVIIKDMARQEEAESIIQSTNFIKIAKSADEAKRLYAYQFKFILKELEKANIEIAAIKMNFFNMSKQDIVNDWNMNVEYWKNLMSINGPLSITSGAKVDISRLVYPVSSKKDNEPVVQ